MQAGAPCATIHARTIASCAPFRHCRSILSVFPCLSSILLWKFSCRCCVCPKSSFLSPFEAKYHCRIFPLFESPYTRADILHIIGTLAPHHGTRENRSCTVSARAPRQMAISRICSFRHPLFVVPLKGYVSSVLLCFSKTIFLA